MGSIWVADHVALRTQVVVKFMAPEIAEDPKYIERFRREAIGAAQIKSPHVVQIFDHGLTSDGTPYIAMELLEGEDLKRRIRRLGVVPPRDVVRIIGHAARALGQAHQLGIVHRDIKPDNLFLIEKDEGTLVKVLDFGIAKWSQDRNPGMTQTGSVIGTPLYMSPEQLLSSKNVDHRADLWALGVVAYHALTGRVPFTGDSIGALTLAVHSGRYAPPSAVRPELPPAIDAWMERALQRDPAARFGSARELAEELERALFPGRRGKGARAGNGVAGAAPHGERGSQARITEMPRAHRPSERGDEVPNSSLPTRKFVPAAEAPTQLQQPSPDGDAAHAGAHAKGAPAPVAADDPSDHPHGRTSAALITTVREGRRGGRSARILLAAGMVAMVGAGLLFAFFAQQVFTQGAAVGAAAPSAPQQPDAPLDSHPVEVKAAAEVPVKPGPGDPTFALAVAAQPAATPRTSAPPRPARKEVSRPKAAPPRAASLKTTPPKAGSRKASSPKAASAPTPAPAPQPDDTQPKDIVLRR